MRLFQRFAIAAFALLLIAGCSGFGGKSNEYKGASARAAQPLEVPPELTAPATDDRYAIPDPRAQTTYSAYSQRPAPTAAAGVALGVLPKIESARLERYGDQRWLVIKAPPEKVWPLVRDFWLESGYTLQRESPELGIMETEWYDDRSKIPTDIVRRTIGRVIEGLYSTARRDKFRTRLEKGAEPGTTEVFVSNRSVEEIYTSVTQERTTWQARPADRELEAEMLTRIMAKLGGSDTKVAAALGIAPGAKDAGGNPPEARNAALENAGAGPLIVNDSFDRAWRRVGLALDRVGFTVEDRDRSKGVFFVRYVDPDVDAKSGQKRSFADKLAFWRPAPKSAQPQFRILVSDAGANMSQVEIQNSQGGAEATPTGRKILGLLFEQLK